MGGMLTQNEHVIFYDSRNSKEHEQNYATHELELAVVVHALRIWKHYLMAKTFDLGIYHHGLKYVFEQPNLNARRTTWMELICEYDFDIKHIKGK